MNKGVVEEQGNVAEIFQHPKQVYTRDLLNHDFGEALHIPEAENLLTLKQVAVKFQSSGITQPGKRLLCRGRTLRFAVNAKVNQLALSAKAIGKSSLALAISRLIKSDGEIVLLGIRF